jgi:hypothetical protein
MLGLSLGLAVGALTSCEDPEPYECETDAQCNLDGEDGRCQDEGYCSYPDPECESGFRFHDDAPEDLAGTCVAVDEGT